MSFTRSCPNDTFTPAASNSLMQVMPFRLLVQPSLQHQVGRRPACTYPSTRALLIMISTAPFGLMPACSLVTPGGALFTNVDDGDDRPAAVRTLVHRIDGNKHGRIAERCRRNTADGGLRVAMMVNVRIVEHDLAPASKPA